jgi:type VI secretion system protein ImpF
VLNYGVPSFSGRRAKDFDPEVLGRELKEVVATFEPRLKRDTIRVIVDTGGRDGLMVRVEGVLMLSPVPERLRLSTTVNLDNGFAMTRIEDS